MSVLSRYLYLFTRYLNPACGPMVMIQFNPDGSIKLPNRMTKKKENEDRRLKIGRCIKVHKEVVSEWAPKKCALNITLSDAISDARFISYIHDTFAKEVETPLSLIKITDKEYKIEVGSTFRRCSDCTGLISRYRQYLDGNLIEEQGTCPRKKQLFTYDDHFE